ncbi:pyridoxal-phosphate dependent enzyme [Microbacterium sp. zg-Y818]|uniref:threonine synthase n=1 Tax=unclassified Microbacterium TaxID=2609290 RepID=UPI00214B58A6|nr:MULTISPECIES: pyridoxal-phosphate dependent enzyme [unclassified Microbacterium]MCR2800224.1 pyridoxal-phosphate dependent enzyme [Microbacterium sp. zg.Y818]WIM22191.1 pyridoxal-phosphate dependent enzyme [Microbacterium sp. zg-Y818]
MWEAIKAFRMAFHNLVGGRRMSGTMKAGTRGHRFACALCGDSDEAFRYDCPSCGGAIVLDANQVTAAELKQTAPGTRGPWRFPALLPCTETRISLGEGDTPLVALPVTDAGERPVFAKLESLNPSLSFKDRAMALGASAAVGLGMDGLVVASTGNAAVSASMYAAAAGLSCVVLVGSESNATKKLDACRVLGADVREIEGDYSAAYAHAKILEGAGWMNVSTTYRNPILAEGYRSLAFELIEQLGRAPSAVIVPIGAGPLLRGIERGFADAVAVGRVGRPPALIGVQAARVAPIHAAWQRRHGPRTATASSERGPTLATAIADRLVGYESHGDLTIAAVERTGGEIVAVEEPEIARATRQLAAIGVWVEPSAATALAALRKVTLPKSARRADVSDEPAAAGPVVLILTGHGAKAPALPPALTT